MKKAVRVVQSPTVSSDGGPPRPGNISSRPSPSNGSASTTPPPITIQSSASSPPQQTGSQLASSSSINPAHLRSMPMSVPVPTLVPPSPVQQDPKDIMRQFPKISGEGENVLQTHVSVEKEPIVADSPKIAISKSTIKPGGIPRVSTLQTNSPVGTNTLNDTYSDILNSAAMKAFNPKVHDQVFTLEKYPADVVQGKSTANTHNSISVKNTKEFKTLGSSSSSRPINTSQGPVLSATATTTKDFHTMQNTPEEYLESDNSYTFFEKMLIFINLIIFLGILFTCYVFLKIYWNLHPEEVGQLMAAILRGLMQGSLFIHNLKQRLIVLAKSYLM